MNWDKFLEIVGDLPLIDTENLLAGVSKPSVIRVQISRWKKAGKIIQLKRGIYVLAKSYRKVEVYEQYIAAILKKPSYISLEKSLEYYNLIPEAVKVYTSITTKRPCKFISELGIFDYKHIKSSLFWGYTAHTVNKQTAFIAVPEKALLDLCYLKNVRIDFNYLQELRLQNTEEININKLFEYAQRFKKPKIMHIAEIIGKYIVSVKRGEKVL